jgi:uncharacterized integral membrane protein
MLQVIFLLVLLFGLLVAVVAVQNTAPVTLRVLVFELSNVALSILVLISIAVGAFLTLLLGLGTWISNVQAIRRRDQTIRRLESDLARERAARQQAALAAHDPASEYRLTFPAERTEPGAEPERGADERPPLREDRPSSTS